MSLGTSIEHQMEKGAKRLIDEGQDILADWRKGKDLTQDEREFLECLSAEILWAGDILQADEDEMESLERKLAEVSNLKREEVSATEKMSKGLHGLESDIDQLTGAIQNGGDIDSVLTTLENHLRLLLEGAYQFSDIESELTSINYDEELLDMANHAHKAQELMYDLSRLRFEKGKDRSRSLKQSFLESIGSKEVKKQIAQRIGELEPIDQKAVEKTLKSENPLLRLAGKIYSIVEVEESLDKKERKRIQQALKEDSHLRQELEEIEDALGDADLTKEQRERIDRALRAVQVTEELLKVTYRFDESELKEDAAVEKFEEGRIDYQNFSSIVKAHTTEETRDNEKLRELHDELYEMYEMSSRGLKL